ncbi:hypothetical protein BDR22DRAFT_969163 [Usnea florida]
MMLSDVFAFTVACNLILTVPFSVATVPYLTTFANSTKITFPSAAGTTGCPSNCTRNDEILGSVTWTPGTITATITAETLVYVVNKKNNSTRTETITNTEADLRDYTPLPTTKTTSVVLQFGTTSRTEILTFPSILYSDYPSSYTFCGTLPTTTAGVATCLRYPCVSDVNDTDPFNSDSPVFAFPTHPSIPNGVQNISASDLALDPKGSTWEAQWAYDSDYDSVVRPLIPDLGAWNCSPFGIFAAPATVLNKALYLTATSTSTEAGDEGGATPAPKASAPKEAPVASAGKEPAKVEPQAVEASQIIANPFGVGKPAAAEKQTQSPSTSSVAALVPAPNQAAGKDEASAEAPASNPAPGNTNSDSGTSPDQAANSNTEPSSIPAVKPASPQSGDLNAAPPSNQPANIDKADSNPPATTSRSPQNENSNNAAPPPLPGLSNQASTAVPAPSANAIATITTSTTNAQGSVFVATTQVPAVILTTTNAQGSKITTTTPVVVVNPPLSAPAPFIVNDHTLTTDSLSHYIIAGQTLSPNTPLILGNGASATPLILQISGSHPVLIVGSSTTTLDLPTSTPTPTTPPPITIGSSTITANSQGQYIVGTQTLTAGGAIVVGGTTASGGTVAVGGTTVSLAPSGGTGAVVVGTSTEGLGPFGIVMFLFDEGWACLL